MFVFWLRLKGMNAINIPRREWLIVGQYFSPFARVSFLDPAMPLSTEDFLQHSLHERGIHPTITDLERQGIEEPKVIRVSGMCWISPGPETLDC